MSSGEEANQKKFGLTPGVGDCLRVVWVIYKGNRRVLQDQRGTVKHHLSNIFDKLGVSTRLELALFAVNQALPIKTIA